MGKHRKKAKHPSYTIGIDVGGTKILALLLDRHFKIKSSVKAKMKVHKGERYFLAAISEMVEELMNQAGIRKKSIGAVGVGCPGLIEFPKGIVQLSPNIPFLKRYPLQSRLSKRLHLHVTIENDVNAGLYGEFQFGAARGFKHVVGVFLGTGIGGALILDRKLYRGASGAAGEIGHTYLTLDTALVEGSVFKGTLEGLIGRHALAAEAAYLSLKQKAPHLYRLTESNVGAIKSSVLRQAIREGDTALRILVERKARILGIALANVANVINPELIVLGGGVMEALSSLILPEARQALREFALPPIAKSVHVVPAHLKDFAVAMGAAKLAEEQSTHAH